MDVAEVRSDMDFYIASLNILLENTVRIGSKLWDEDNRPSMLAMMVYSYKEDKDLEKWMTGYAKDHHAYFADQNKNFSHMKQDFERFCSRFCA